MHHLFDGPSSLRDPKERLAFWLTILLVLPAAFGLAQILHESIGPAQVALFLVGAMLYITLARGRLIGSSVMIHENQYPRVFSIVKRACATLEIPMPIIFAREDNYTPVAALGFGEPYSLIISSHWIEAFSDDELAFMIGRELGHIAAGHARYLSLLSVNGKENPIIAILFGAWLRRCTFTCDKVGLLVCGTFDAALRAIAVAEFHEFGRKIDTAAFAEQAREIQGDSVLRMGTWLGSEPYATARIASLQKFMASHAYEVAENWFLRPVTSEEPPALPTPGTIRVNNSDCSGWWRRFTSLAIDFVVVYAIMSSFGQSLFLISAGGVVPTVPSVIATTAPSRAHRTGKLAATPGPGLTTPTVVSFPWNEFVAQLTDDAAPLARAVHNAGFNLWFPLYLFVLVAMTGQTFGMMIAGLRVVTVDFGRVGPWRALARALLGHPFLWLLIFLASLFSRRILLHDRFTKTRVVKVERVLARIALPVRAEA